MSIIFRSFFLGAILLGSSYSAIAQNDTIIEDEEDYSMYDDVEDVGEITTYCSPKIFDLSPNRFISIGHDFAAAGKLTTSREGAYAPDSVPGNTTRSGSVFYNGLRINANIPVVSKSSLVWQMGGGINQARFNAQNIDTGDHGRFIDELEKGLTSVNLNTTIFKPLGEKNFLILQVMGELNGNYTFKNSNSVPKFENTRLSSTLLWGKRPHDRLQWGVGLSRTFRAGEMNYIPIVMYNYTSKNRKWGTEILFPAKAAYRRKFNPTNILLIGYELEGTTYRLYDTKFNAQNLELRRSEIRIRLDYQRQIKGFYWMGIQAGVIANYNFSVDDLTATNNKEFFRGFFGEQTFTFLNGMSPMPYVNISFNLVSL